jgi:type I phosphodiesterase/nucleotide pyrophosphatase
VRSRLAVVLLAAAALGIAAQAPGPEPATLVLALDGVGYRNAVEAEQRGLLRGWRRAVPVVSTFPSLTSVAFTGMVHPLGYPPAPGYENRHYDWKRNKVLGGLPYIRFPWHEYFRLDRNSLMRKTFGYFWPRRLVHSDLERVFDAVLESPEPFVTAYLANTDALVHMQGPQAAVDLLDCLHRWIPEVQAEYRKRHGRGLRVVLISDHGMTSIQQRPVRGLKDHLARGGFRLRGSIVDDHSVVIARFGYVEACMLYCRDSLEAPLSRWLARLEGIQLCAYAESGGVMVVSADGGEARVEFRPRDGGGLELRYRPFAGDPLRHAEIVEHLRQDGQLDAEGYAPAQAWLEQSVDAEFPDALTRLHHAFYGQDVENKASVIFSTKPGWAFGHPVTRALSWLRGGRLEATHGALTAEASLAMLLTDDPDLPLPAVLRYDQVLPFLEKLRPAKE